VCEVQTANPVYRRPFAGVVKLVLHCWCHEYGTVSRYVLLCTVCCENSRAVFSSSLNDYLSVRPGMQHWARIKSAQCQVSVYRRATFYSCGAELIGKIYLELSPVLTSTAVQCAKITLRAAVLRLQSSDIAGVQRRACVTVQFVLFHDRYKSEL